MPDDATGLDDNFARYVHLGRTICSLSSMVSVMTGLADNSTDSGPVSDLPALMNAVKAKNRDAFSALYDATVNRVYGLALRITRQQELAEEVVSDVYLQVWQKADSYSAERGKVIAWLCVLCRSRALDALRRDSAGVRQAMVSLDSVAEQKDLREPPDLLQSVEQGSSIHAALGELSEQQRQLVALAYFRGHTHTELATITGVPIGTVKSRLRRAIIKLKEIMSQSAETNGESDE